MNGFYITKDSSNLVEIWNLKPKKIKINQNDFIFGRPDETGVIVSDNNFLRSSIKKGQIKFITVKKGQIKLIWTNSLNLNI